MLTRTIPSTGEEIPAVGLGTWIGFDVGGGEAERAPRRAVLERLFAAGGTVIDSSPMYGRAEQVTGDLLAETGTYDRGFLATKVWTRGRRAGIREMERSLARMRTDRMDLMQIHNMVDWRTQLATLRDWKEAGRVRYIGITHYTRSAFDDLAAIIRAEPLDFVQLPYSVTLPDAAEALLPLCAERGIATLVNRPFDGGALFDHVRGHDVPDWAREELGCASWGAFFLRFILAHAAVTCVIPGTGNPARAGDDFASGAAPVPSEADARRMLAYWRAL